MKIIRSFSFVLLCLFSLILLCSCNTCLHFTMYKETTPATCTSAGKTTYSCADCDYTYFDDIVEPRGHQYKITVTEPTCEAGGYTTYVCSCGHSYVSDHTAASGHDFTTNATINPSCTEQGYTYHKCENCEYYYVDGYIKPNGHNFENTTTVTPPTCTKQGYTTYKCADCSYSYVSDYKAITDHKLTSKVTAPTCTEQGYTTYTCPDCEYTYVSDIIEPSGHDLKDGVTVTDPTCTEQGYTTYKCAKCDYMHVTDYVKPYGHDYTDSQVITPPTCTEQGYTTYTCNVCEYSYSSDYTDPSDHTYSETVLTEVTCTSIGVTEYACTCGDKYSITTAATGHDFETSVTMPTLSDMGYTEYFCKNCEYQYVGDYRFYKDILPNGAYSDNAEVLANGIDISEYNYDGVDVLDFASIKASGIDYVIIKAGSSYRNGYSLGGRDPRFEQSYADAKASGLDVGVYFYTYARSVDEIIYDAELLLTILAGKQFEYPIYLDLEDDSLSDISQATLTEMCIEFFTVLQRAGYYTGLYVNNEWLTDKIQTSEALSKFEIWYARYPENTEIAPEWNEYEYGSNLGMWQFSDKGSFDAIPEIPFDLNYAYKDYPSIIKEGGFNGYESDVKFIDSGKEFVYVISSAIYVRSTPDFESSVNLLGTALKGARFEVLEKNPGYTKIRYQGHIAFISANPIYVSFEMPTPE